MPAARNVGLRWRERDTGGGYRWARVCNHGERQHRLVRIATVRRRLGHSVSVNPFPIFYTGSLNLDRKPSLSLRMPCLSQDFLLGTVPSPWLSSQIVRRSEL